MSINFKNAHITKVESLSDDSCNLNFIISTTNNDEHSAAVKKARAMALSRGETVVNDDGSRVWRETRALFAPEKTGSERYDWHEGGDRVRAERVEITWKPCGARAERRLRKTWVRF